MSAPVQCEAVHSSSGQGPPLRSAGLPSAKWLPLPQISPAGQTWVREGLLEMTKDTRLCVCLAMFVVSGKCRLPESQPSEWETDLNKQVIRMQTLLHSHALHCGRQHIWLVT